MIRRALAFVAALLLATTGLAACADDEACAATPKPRPVKTSAAKPKKTKSTKPGGHAPIHVDIDFDDDCED